jgi:hypothetical protein
LSFVHYFHNIWHKSCKYGNQSNINSSPIEELSTNSTCIYTECTVCILPQD